MTIFKVAVVGAGPAGLMAAETLASTGMAVTIYERMPSVGRKFLLAGRGGLNLTHSEPLPAFVSRYGRAAERLAPAIEAFAPDALRQWSHDLGEPTFVGSSGRVFPARVKTSPLLRAWLRRLDASGVAFRLRHRWTGWTQDGDLAFDTPDGPASIQADATILALGGASWPQLGSDGGWAPVLAGAGIGVAALRPSNCGFLVGWSDLFRERFAGQPLKNIRLTFEDRAARGELVVTQVGLEGNALYALSGPLRDAIDAEQQAVTRIALRPDQSKDDLVRRLAVRPPKQSISTFLRKALKLDPVAIALLQEVAIGRGQPLSGMTADALAALVNDLPVRLTGTTPLARAISTAGGIAFDEISQDWMLAHRAGTFVAGEMLDWEAPTGGYLLQASFATGVAAGQGAVRWLRQKQADAAPAQSAPLVP